MMTKKDYIAIAKMFNESDNLNNLYYSFVEYAKSDNPRFNEDTFKKAVFD